MTSYYQIQLVSGPAPLLKATCPLLYAAPPSPSCPPGSPFSPCAPGLLLVCVCVQPSRSTRVHHGDKAEERGRLCVICAVQPPPSSSSSPPPTLPPRPLGRGGGPRRGLFGPGERRARHQRSQRERRRDERRDSLQRPWLSAALDSLAGTTAFNRPLICTVQKAREAGGGTMPYWFVVSFSFVLFFFCLSDVKWFYLFGVLSAF